MFITSHRRRSSAECSTNALSLIEQAPDNFTPERFPILARHWFGLRPAGTAYPRKRAGAHRAPGPGEIATIQACRERGLHRRLVEAWWP